MKRWLIAAAAAALVAGISLHYHSAHAAHLPTAGKPYIAHWHDDANAAVSFTFDDGLQCHADIAAPLLHQFGYRGTFFIVAGLTRQHKPDPIPVAWTARNFRYGEAALSWDEVRHMRDLGMEIGNHSLIHTFLNHIPDDPTLTQQIDGSAQLITENLGQPPLTFAFPYNEYSPHDKDLALAHHLAIRENWTDWGGPNFTAAQSNALFDKAIKAHSWLVPMIHGIDGGFLPLSSNVFRQNLAYLKQHSSDVWVDTYADVARYQMERNAATLHVEDSEPGEVTLYITEDKPVASGVPLTVVLPLPLNDNTDEVDARVDSNEEPVPFVRQNDRILVTLPAGSSPVTVTWH